VVACHFFEEIEESQRLLEPSVPTLATSAEQTGTPGAVPDKSSQPSPAG